MTVITSRNQREEVRDQEVGAADLLGIGRDRLVLRWISAAEGELFGSTVDSFVASLQSKGPLRRLPDGA